MPTTRQDLPDPHEISGVPGVRSFSTRPYADWVTLAGGSAWVANVGDGIGRYDLRTGEFRGSVPVGTDIDLAMDAGFESLWAGDCASTTLLRISTSTGDVLVAQIDPNTNTVVARFGPASGSGSVAADDDALWISAHDVFTVWRVPLIPHAG